MEIPIGHSKAGFSAVISEAKLGDRISHTRLSDTSSGIVMLDYPISIRKGGKVRVQVSGVF